MNIFPDRRMTSSIARRLVITAMAVVYFACLNGCAVTLHVWDARQVQAPKRVLSVPVGQPAYVYFRQLDSVSRVSEDMQAWRDTGFFKSVTQAVSEEPVKSGVFISVDCDRTGYIDRGNGFMAMLSLFILPGIMTEISNECRMVYFQDGVQAASASANVTYKKAENGFSLIPLWLMGAKQDTTIAEEAAAIRVSNMMKALSK